uniref:Uncharacterized protein n=1 Tax=Sinocyclocheilus rhinocerous TaxID=307959 RepID=A0A673MVB5_9TELE
MFSTVLLSQIILTLFCQAFCFEPTEEDLKCFNDYETEMKCSLSTDRLKSCCGYKFQKMYACIFERSNHSDNCECKIKVQDFLLNENFTSTLLEGTNVLSSKTFKTEDFIKPKTPVLSVQKTENGNFNVTWDDQYEKRVLEDLRINLTYGIKGGHENLSRTKHYLDIIGK